ncbi:acetyl-CoA synthetase-like protein [Ramaria rubella]|nr:acetyl-CoA synthetase-like protein [Ramaria rubella]
MYLRSLYPPVPSIPSTNYHNVLFNPQGAEEVPDFVLYIDAVTGQKCTRSEFKERMYDAATSLGAPEAVGGLGLTSKDMVGILSDNCINFSVLVHSLLVLATPFALLSTYATPRELAHYLEKSKATHIFVEQKLLSTFMNFAREAGFPEDHIYILQGSSPSVPRLRHFDPLIEHIRHNNVPREPVREAGKDTPAYIVFSSGTSGLPKAVMASHGNLSFTLYQRNIVIQEAANVVKVITSANPNVVPVGLGFLPFFHVYGLHLLCLRAPARPTTHVLMPRWNLDLAVTCIPKYRVNTISAIPSVVYQLVNSPQFHKIDRSSIVSFGSGAAYLPPKLAERLKKLLAPNITVLDGYGMSEATVSIAGRPQPGILGGRAESSTNSAGILLPGMEAVILRPDGTHCLPMESGDLYVKGGNITLGYLGNPEATKEAFLPNGWLKTGDHFKANSRGSLFFENRAKDTLKVSGLQVSPAEIEDTLLAEPSGIVSDVAVAGVQTPGARTSDDRSPRAWVVLSMQGRVLGEREARERLEHWARKNLSKYKWLRGGIQFIQEIPKNPTGKILRRVLQDQYLAESTHAKL